MLKPEDMMISIKKSLGDVFPGEKIYENVVPQKFARPSNMVELSGMQIAEASTSAVTIHYSYRITDFVPVDERHNSDMALLDLRTLQILGIFAAGYIKAGDRAPRVYSCSTEHNFDYTVTTVVLRVTYDRSDFGAVPDTTPYMGKINLKEDLI